MAASKVEALVDCGLALLTVIAPTACGRIVEHAGARRLRWLRRPYAHGDLAHADLVFAATGDRVLNAAVATEARERGILVLAVDDVANCDFIAPALVRRGNLLIAISTHGRSPAVARRVREWLDCALPSHWGELLEVAAAARERLGARRRSIPPDAWQTCLDGPVDDLTRRGDTAGAADLLLACLVRHLRQ